MRAFPLFFVLAVLAGWGEVFSDEPAVVEKKEVALCWFPRFSHDGTRLAVAHGNWDAKLGGDVMIWNVADGEVVSSTPVSRGIRSVAWSAKDEFVLAGGYGGFVRTVDAGTGKQVHEMKVGSQTEGVAVFSDDSRFVTTHGNGDVVLWNFAKRRPVNVWNEVHKEGIWGMALSPDDLLVATAGQDGFVRLLDLKSYTVLHEWKHPNRCNGVTFTHDSARVLTGCEDATIRVFDVKSGEEVRQLKGHERSTITDLRFSPDGKTLVSSGGDGTLRLWDWTNPGEPTLAHTIQAHQAMAFGVDISPDGKRLASVGWDNQVKMWNLETREEMWSKKRPE